MKKIFFDESNTSGSYIDANNKAIISATGYWEDEYINNKAMEITNGKEIKGSDLYTKSNTKLRKNIIKILSKDGKKRFSSFVKNHYMSTSFSATYDALCVYDLNQFLNEEGKAKLFKFQQILSLLATKNSKEELVLIQEELNNERNYEIIIKSLKKIWINWKVEKVIQKNTNTLNILGLLQKMNLQVLFVEQLMIDSFEIKKAFTLMFLTIRLTTIQTLLKIFLDCIRLIYLFV